MLEPFLLLNLHVAIPYRRLDVDAELRRRVRVDLPVVVEEVVEALPAAVADRRRIRVRVGVVGDAVAPSVEQRLELDRLRVVLDRRVAVLEVPRDHEAV